MGLSSPFQRVPGTFKYGDYTYEWRTLLNTPCNGFNGPNACYSSTCKHDGSSKFKEQQQQLATKKVRFVNKPESSSKISMKFNFRTVHVSGSDSESSSSSNNSSCSSINGDGERMFDDNLAAKSLLTKQMKVYVHSNLSDHLPKFYGSNNSSGSSTSCSSPNGDGDKEGMVDDNPVTKSFLTEQMKVYVRSNLNGNSPKFYGGHFNFDGRSINGQPIQQFFTTSPMIEFNVHVKSPSAAYYSPSSTSSSPTFFHSGRSLSESSYDGASMDSSSTEHGNRGKRNNNKTYSFNPLSKPFHPTTKKNRSVTCPSDNVSCTPASKTTTTKAVPQNPPKIDSTAHFPKAICQPDKYVCILCPKTFPTATELQQHIENKTQQPYDCVICGATFTHGYQLHRHLWIHLKNHRRIRSFNCRACQKKFRSLNQLHKHYELCQYKLYIFF